MDFNRTMASLDAQTRTLSESNEALRKQNRRLAEQIARLNTAMQALLELPEFKQFGIPWRDDASAGLGKAGRRPVRPG